MTSGWIVGLELGLTVAVVVGWGVWELWSLRRDRRQRAHNAQDPAP